MASSSFRASAGSSCTNRPMLPSTRWMWISRDCSPALMRTPPHFRYRVAPFDRLKQGVFRALEASSSEPLQAEEDLGQLVDIFLYLCYNRSSRKRSPRGERHPDSGRRLAGEKGVCYASWRERSKT